MTTTASRTLAARILNLTNRPGFARPDTTQEITIMRALAELVLDSDSIIASEALHFAQQGLLLDAMQRTPGATFQKCAQHPANRALFEAYSLLISGLMRRDMLLSRCIQ